MQKNELAKAIRVLNLEKSKLELLNKDLDQCAAGMLREAAAGTCAWKLKEYGSYIPVLNCKIELQEENVNKSQNNVDKEREKLVKAVKERKILDKLKEMRFLEFLKEQDLMERKATDEVAAYKFYENLAGESDG